MTTFISLTIAIAISIIMIMITIVITITMITTTASATATSTGTATCTVRASCLQFFESWLHLTIAVTLGSFRTCERDLTSKPLQLVPELLPVEA